MEIIHPEDRWLEEPEEEVSPGLKLFTAITTNVLLFFLVFGLSATVEMQHLKDQLTNKAAIFTGVAMQFLIMPVLGFIAVSMLEGTGFSQPMGITLLVVTASPGGSFSNLFCSVFNADLALSVAMTSISSILSVGLLPANLIFYSWLAYVVVMPEGNEKVDILEALDLKSIFITLGAVMGGIILGLYTGYVHGSPKFHMKANKFGSFCGFLLIMFSVFLGSGGGGGNSNFWSLPWSFYVGVAFPCVVGMLLANIVSRCFKLSHPETVAISIECCYQNTAIATSVAATMFSNPTTRSEAISVPLFYGMVEACLISLYCLWAWKVGWTKAPANEKLCVILTRTYEIEDNEDIEWVTEGNKKSWFARLFVPKALDGVHSPIDEVSTGGKPSFGEKHRQRCESSDVTVSTNRSRNDSAEVPFLNGTSSPPGTPDSVPKLQKSFDSTGDIEGGRLEPLSEESFLQELQEQCDESSQTQQRRLSASNSNVRPSPERALRRNSSCKSIDMTGDLSVDNNKGAIDAEKTITA